MRKPRLFNLVLPFPYFKWGAGEYMGNPRKEVEVKRLQDMTRV